MVYGRSSLIIRRPSGVPMLKEEWQESDHRIALDHPYVTVELRTVHLPDGRTIPDWPIVQTGNYINALVGNEQGEFMIIEGYKHAIGRSSWQVLGGFVDEGEEPLAAAQRELLEETGYASDEWHYLGSFITDPNRYTALGHFYLARNARPVALPNHDDLEKFTVRWVSAVELRQAVGDGRIQVVSYGLTIALGLLVIGY
jgi:ADP-ribose pyrophosphatase